MNLNLPMPTVEVDTTDTPIAEQRALERSLEIHQRNQAVQETHEDAVDLVGSTMVAGAIGGSLGGPKGAALGAFTGGGLGAYHFCWVACHNESPPKEPPVPEIETEDEEEEKKKQDEGN